ncbi:hypothetical protein [Vibrio owensii]|uniref:hypothetical protein n=1 Tax=Vibrio owensii TaxID=696485 RepID=UPI00155DA80D|nr:hypothetical protein [Vibrio owensii]
MKLHLNPYDLDKLMPLARELGIRPIDVVRHLLHNQSNEAMRALCKKNEQQKR